MKIALAAALNWFKKALFPDKCLVCCSEGAVLCTTHDRFPAAPVIILSSENCLTAVYAATDYQHKTVQALIKKLKFGRHKAALSPIVNRLQERVNWDKFEGYELVPLPLHWSRQHWRGFNQSALIAQSLALNTGLKVNHNLKRFKFTRQQARLTGPQRLENLTNAFAWRSYTSPPPKVILIDDVYTTGQTLFAAAKCLRQAGVKTVVGVVFAHQAKGG
jgi:ComF family protein